MFACLHVVAPRTGAAGISVVLERLGDVARDMTPRWERVTPGDVLLDVSGLRRMFGGPDGIAAAIRRLALERGLQVRVATADAWSVALLQAAWPGPCGAHVPAGAEAAALDAMPVEALGLLPGVTGTWVWSRTLDAANEQPVPMSEVPARRRPSRLGGARHYRLSAGQGLVQASAAGAHPTGAEPGHAAPARTGTTAADDVQSPAAPPGHAAGVGDLDGGHRTPVDDRTFSDGQRRWYDVRAALRRWGIHTCGALAALPTADLHARLGRYGVWLQQRARGVDPRPLRTQPPHEVFEETLALEWPIEGLEPLSFVLPRVLDPLCAHLAARDRAAVVVRTVLRLTDRQQHLRAIELPAPVCDARVLRTLLLLDLEAHPPHAGIDAITVAVDPAPGRITQHSLLRKALPTEDARVALLARLTALMGEGRCGAPALVDSHRPGAVALELFEPEAVTVPTGVSLASMATVAAGRARLPAVEPALEGWRDTAGYHVRRLRRPWPITVRATPAGRPCAVGIGARGWTDGTVTQAAGPWRSSGAWWQDAPGAADATPAAMMLAGRPRSTVHGLHGSETAQASRTAQPRTLNDPGRIRGQEPGARSQQSISCLPWDRDEWDVALQDGTTYRIFQDRTTQQWWLDGEVD
jgi:hypothetical protein